MSASMRKDLKCNYIQPEIQNATVNLYPCINVPKFDFNPNTYKTLNYFDRIMFNKQDPSNQPILKYPNICAGSFSETEDSSDQLIDPKQKQMIEPFTVDMGPGEVGPHPPQNFIKIPCHKNPIQVCRSCNVNYTEPNYMDPCNPGIYNGIDNIGNMKCKTNDDYVYLLSDNIIDTIKRGMEVQ